MENNGEIELDNCATVLPHCLAAIILKLFAINARISSVKTLSCHYTLQTTMILPWHSSSFTQRKKKQIPPFESTRLKLCQNVFLAFLYSAI